MATPRIKIDPARQEVFFKGKRIFLTSTEYRLLILLKEYNKTLSREEILTHLYSPAKRLDRQTRTIDQHVGRLRRKLRSHLIETVPGYGYKWVGV